MVPLTERLKIALTRPGLTGLSISMACCIEGGSRFRAVQPKISALARSLGIQNDLQRNSSIYSGYAGKSVDASMLWRARHSRFKEISCEAGVYQGGTARLLRRLIESSPNRRCLHLFDTFLGMPATNREHDHHQAGDFSNTSTEAVSSFVGREDWISYHKGLIPQTFKGLESVRVALSHIDVDIYQSVVDCCQFLYPRTVPGGFLLFDDYGFPSCPGARAAVDEFFRRQT